MNIVWEKLGDGYGMEWNKFVILFLDFKYYDDNEREKHFDIFIDDIHEIIPASEINNFIKKYILKEKSYQKVIEIIDNMILGDKFSIINEDGDNE